MLRGLLVSYRCSAFFQVSDYAGVEIKTKGTTSLQVLGTEDLIVTPSTKRTSLNSASVALQKKPQFEKLYGQSSQAETSESTPPVKDAELSEIKNAMIKGKKPVCTQCVLSVLAHRLFRRRHGLPSSRSRVTALQTGTMGFILLPTLDKTLL